MSHFLSLQDVYNQDMSCEGTVCKEKACWRYLSVTTAKREGRVIRRRPRYKTTSVLASSLLLRRYVDDDISGSFPHPVAAGRCAAVAAQQPSRQAVLLMEGNNTHQFTGIPKSLHSLHNIYIANLAVADLMVTGYVVPFWVTDLCLGHHPVINDTHCQVNGFLVMICFVVSIYTLVLISFNRYLGVCRHEVFVKLFTQKTVVSSCVVLWILTIAVFVLPFFHISHSAYTYSTRLVSVCTTLQT
ncbi:hypothetical protein C0Q70_00583 [Pomacea canaliculata]|uniref:G-protein coupled receptors family 1 profile domain-containing protein n=1 Tax=Pomacea canaliculata TaxID=400727 RepID=A0A2T7PX22_POMCA|nr:hypothetical protein C0Q70_00583 [Pomacea canaliculata]